MFVPMSLHDAGIVRKHSAMPLINELQAFEPPWLIVRLRFVRFTQFVFRRLGDSSIACPSCFSTRRRGEVLRHEQRFLKQALFMPAWRAEH